jgi:hypothetical protein
MNTKPGPVFCPLYLRLIWNPPFFLSFRFMPVVEDFEREQEAIPRTANAASATMRIAFILS